MTTYLAHEFQSFSQMASDPLINVNDLWFRFKSIIVNSIKNYIPLRTLKTRQHNPWISRNVIHAKRKVKRLRCTLKTKGGSPLVNSRLKSATKDFKTQVTNAKQHYRTLTKHCHNSLQTTRRGFGTISAHPQPQLQWYRRKKKQQRLTSSTTTFTPCLYPITARSRH